MEIAGCFKNKTKNSSCFFGDSDLGWMEVARNQMNFPKSASYLEAGRD